MTPFSRLMLVWALTVDSFASSAITGSTNLNIGGLSALIKAS